VVNRELLDRCRRGEPGAFEELVERTQRQVYTLAYRLTGDRHEAEDVAQEAYLRAFRSMGGFREDARFETWLYRIVTNAAMTQLRRKGRFGVLITEQREQQTPELTWGELQRVPYSGNARHPRRETEAVGGEYEVDGVASIDRLARSLRWWSGVGH
jgi:RNA polymerase sigma factor (sigma-70 family)